jgi:hypothetical protein
VRARIRDLPARGVEIPLPKYVIDAIADVICAYSIELELDESDFEYKTMIAFSNDVAQAVVAALAGKVYSRE